MINPKLKRLETLVLEALERLKSLGDENRRLRRDVASLKEEKAVLEGRLRDTRALKERHERLRSRLERLAQRIDKAIP